MRLQIVLVTFKRSRFSVIYLEVAQLSELLAAVIESASERLDLLVDDFVRANIAALRKGLAADITAIWTFSSMTPLMCLQTKLAKVDRR
jgi:hypothetical protein